MYTKYNYTYLCKSICILQYVKLIKYSYNYKSMYTNFNYTYMCDMLLGEEFVFQNHDLVISLSSCNLSKLFRINSLNS